MAKYALPYDIEFRAELPKTLVGKVAYRVLEEEELQKLAASVEPQDAAAVKSKHAGGFRADCCICRTDRLLRTRRRRCGAGVLVLRRLGRTAVPVPDAAALKSGRLHG